MARLPSGETHSANQPRAYIPDVDVGSPLSATAYAPRSDTPTQSTQRSPTSPAFSNFDLSPRGGSKRTSRQNTPSSPFNVTAFPSLGYSPRANSSRSSLDSAGSSFHSWDESDKVLKSFSNSADPQPIVWHDFEVNQTNSVSPVRVPRTTMIGIRRRSSNGMLVSRRGILHLYRRNWFLLHLQELLT